MSGHPFGSGGPPTLDCASHACALCCGKPCLPPPPATAGSPMPPAAQNPMGVAAARCLTGSPAGGVKPPWPRRIRESCFAAESDCRPLACRSAACAEDGCNAVVFHLAAKCGTLIPWLWGAQWECGFRRRRHAGTACAVPTIFGFRRAEVRDSCTGKVDAVCRYACSPGRLCRAGGGAAGKLCLPSLFWARRLGTVLPRKSMS